MAEWHKNVATGIGRPVVIGILILALGFGGFGTWAAVAPLAGAVVAPGTVVTLGRNKLVQHLEGGIVREILVKEGERVEGGQPLIVLDPTQPEARRNRIQAQLDVLDALEARAVAERDGDHEIAFPEALLAKDTPEVVRVVADQRAEFEARFEKHQAELGILGQQMAALNEEITGLEAQKQAIEIQLELIQEEKADTESLLQKGLARKTRALELRRAEADLIGRQGQLTAAIAKARQTITEAEQQIQRLRIARLEEAVSRLSDVRLKRSDFTEQLRAAQDVLDRLVVRTPVPGTVMQLTKYNPGAVISPGEPLMEIVPESSGLVIEAHVRPQDIDEVRLGQQARLAFSALDQREVPPVPGEVDRVSADRFVNDKTGEAYYLVRLAITVDPIEGFDPAAIGPGQPVEVFITTEERTFLTYLTDPIRKTFRRSLRES
ncbi:HlyD family type I secretion periplasmic adaptor subunit [Lutibaculum baratangense]|uniref:Membrane fusion protein (MFP) family protein n=1 Tax=Lutibaculum baratangense AMV1 TaxID=631454 RepID=V4TC48_9HYPH|nr:HlyD family type I secretion periplasmic adaptor subunit [Lutibaculum baratangense]ESR23898.1 Type I secretion membrane fusion protein, HlyD [Lutibaculum baratangense AMV1]